MHMPIRDDALFWRLAAILMGVGFLLLALFIAWPDLDLLAAAQFHDGYRFPAGEGWLARWLRKFYHLAFGAACAVVIFGLIGVLLRTPERRTPARAWVFVALLFALGPGVLVNTVLKDNWGRARPASIAEFGGDRSFTLPFQIADQCDRNCSFVSGEGSAAAAVAGAGIALFWPLLRGLAGRAVAVATLGLWFAGAAYIRMAPGRHFLSDTLFAFVLVALVALALYAAMDLGRVRREVTPAGMARDLKLVALDAARRMSALIREIRAPINR
ncbi:MAG: phosphatase PAP2 family protein [Rubrimonas sp.]